VTWNQLAVVVVLIAMLCGAQWTVSDKISGVQERLVALRVEVDELKSDEQRMQRTLDDMRQHGKQ
jgi:hypothetical protein